ncbi:MAG: hypothetical protein J6C98_07740 [Oscillospiraceae bacterium]|nr:hypothetical protein [Oscillospiraceae bacterium]
MTPAEALRKECEEITQRTGRYIPPYRMASLMRTAQKIAELLTKTDVCITYEECSMVLDIVSGAIRNATGQKVRNAYEQTEC